MNPVLVEWMSLLLYHRTSWKVGGTPSKWS